MATFIGDQITAGTAFPRGPLNDIILRSMRYTYTLVGALANSDVIEMAPVLPGMTVFDVILETTDLDTNGSPTMTFDVGDGDDVDRYIDGTTAPGLLGGGLARKNTLTAPRLYTVKDTIDVLVLTVATSATTGSIALTLFYTDPFNRLSRP